MSLTPAYDICPQGRAGNEASQAMLIRGDNRPSKLATCLAAANNFLLSKDAAKATFEVQKETINNKWDAICNEAGLSEVDKNLLWGQQFINLFATEEIRSQGYLLRHGEFWVGWAFMPTRQYIYSEPSPNVFRKNPLHVDLYTGESELLTITPNKL